MSCDCEQILRDNHYHNGANVIRDERKRRAEAAAKVEPTDLERALCRSLMRLSIAVGGLQNRRYPFGYDESDWDQIMAAAGPLGGDNE